MFCFHFRSSYIETAVISFTKFTFLMGVNRFSGKGRGSLNKFIGNHPNTLFCSPQNFLYIRPCCVSETFLNHFQNRALFVLDS